MKKLLAIWALVALLFPVFSHATTVNITSDRAWIEESVTKVEINFGKGVLERGDHWKQAVLNPNVVMPIEEHIVPSRDGLFHIKERKITDVGVVYDGTSVNLVHGVVDSKELVYTPYVWVWIASIILMGLGILAFLKARYTVAFGAAFAALAATLVAALAAPFVAVPNATLFAALFAALAVTGLAHAVDAVERKTFFFASGIYGVCMTASMISFMLH